MHYLVKLIVEADSKVEALSQANSDAQQMVEWGDFDWYTLDGRWGKSTPHRVGSKKGKELISEAMEAQRSDFDSALLHIRYMMEHYSDDQIFEEDFGDKRELDLPEGVYYLSRYMFSKADDKVGPHLYAIDGNLWGGKVFNNKDLTAVLKTDSDVHPLWVVAVDFHA